MACVADPTPPKTDELIAQAQPDAAHAQPRDPAGQAIQDELAPQQTIRTEGVTVTQINGQSNRQNGISPKQVDFAHRLAGQIRGLGVRHLDALAVTMFSKLLAQLSSFDGSALSARSARPAGDVRLSRTS